MALISPLTSNLLLGLVSPIPTSPPFKYESPEEFNLILATLDESRTSNIAFPVPPLLALIEVSSVADSITILPPVFLIKESPVLSPSQNSSR